MVSQLPPTGSIQPASVASTPPRTETLSTWRVGQVLAATVIANPQPGQAELRIGNLRVTAQTGTLQLAPGQNLRLEVASLKEQPVLKLLGLLQQSPVTQALRDALPRQQPLAPLFAALTRIAGGSAQTQALAQAATRLAHELFTRLPDSTSIATASGLRQALRDSGLFLESKLARATAPPPGMQGMSNPQQGAELNRDLKANLLRLVSVLRENAANSAPAATARTAAAASSPATSGTTAQALTNASANVTAARIPTGLPPDLGNSVAPLQRGQPPLPPLSPARLAQLMDATNPRELLRQSEGALARLQLNQLASLPQERQPGMEWLIELPVRRDQDVDLWNLRISRDPEHGSGHEGDDAAGGWSVMLAFDLPGIGPMQTRVNLRGERISAQFFSQTAGVLPLVHEHLPLLEARLRQAGLQIDDISCHHGQIPAAATPRPTRLLDERA